MRSNRLVHLRCIHIGDHHNAGPFAAHIGFDEFAEHGENLRPPAQNHGMVAFNDFGFAFAHLAQALFKAGTQDANECTKHEDAPEGHRKHQKEIAPTATITADRPSVHDAHQQHPHHVAGINIGAELEDGRHNGSNHHDDECQCCQHCNQGAGAFRQHIVEFIPESLRKRRLRHCVTSIQIWVVHDGSIVPHPRSVYVRGTKSL